MRGQTTEYNIRNGIDTVVYHIIEYNILHFHETLCAVICNRPP